MKRIFFCICISLLIFKKSTNAQSGFQTGRYYDDQYQISDRPIGVAERRFDYNGNYIGVYQLWQRAEWHRESGGQYVYIWSGTQWQYQWYNGSCYWYEWVNYERYMGY